MNNAKGQMAAKKIKCSIQDTVSLFYSTLSQVRILFSVVEILVKGLLTAIPSTG